jgi:hypothetical protein
MAETTYCPECKKGVMEIGNAVFTIPALMDNSFSNQPPISDRVGMPVRTAICPECRYVKLFVVKM